MNCTVVDVAVAAVAAAPPTVTPAALERLVPVRVTTVPPARGPCDLLTALIVGDGANVNAETFDADPLSPVIVTVTVWAACAEVVTAIDVADFVEMTAAAPPKDTPVTQPRFVPEIVTLVPPDVLPVDFDSVVISGRAAYVKIFEAEADPPAVTNEIPTDPRLFTGVTKVT